MTNFRIVTCKARVFCADGLALQAMNSTADNAMQRLDFRAIQVSA
jgi:hypothetical protein